MGFVEVFCLLTATVAGCFYVIYHEDMHWDILSVDLIGHSHLTFLSPIVLACIRLFFALTIWLSIGYIVIDRNGLTITVMTRDGSKRSLLLKYFERLTMFTVWSWILQGFYFSLASYYSFQVALEPMGSTLPELPAWLQRATWVLFEISFPVAFLVSMVVTFVLIPGCKRDNIPAKIFFQFLPLLMHNANVAYMAFEFVANQLPFVIWHIVFMLFYAIAYVIFSWIWHEVRGIYYYYFLDYERPGAILWYLGLLVGISVLFLAGYFCSMVQYNYDHTIPNLVVIGLTFVSMKIIE